LNRALWGLVYRICHWRAASSAARKLSGYSGCHMWVIEHKKGERCGQTKRGKGTYDTSVPALARMTVAPPGWYS
jgi:hypothetical protein